MSADQSPVPPQDDADLAVTVVVSRRPRPGRVQDLVEWAHDISDAASRFPGHLGATVYPPEPPERADLVIAFSFANAADLASWEHSDVRAEWLRRGEPLIQGPQRSHGFTGFESLLGPGDATPVVPPPRWKTAVIIGLGLFPLSLLVNWLLVPMIVSWPLLLRVLVTTVVIVPLMTWVAVPQLSRLLHSWLRRRPPS
jgi:uncharacterized protein